eukprot:3564587-Karenia_brevis.AAC.1
MFWNQPRNNKRAVYLTTGYMSPTSAEGLADLMGFPVEKDRLPDDDFLEEAKKPLPIYFETDDRTLEGVCCVCFKKGCLGRCPNP